MKSFAKTEVGGGTSARGSTRDDVKIIWLTKLFAHLFCLKIEIVKVILDENFNYQVRRHHSPDPHGISMEWQVLNGKKWMESKKRRVESIAGF